MRRSFLPVPIVTLLFLATMIVSCTGFNARQFADLFDDRFSGSIRNPTRSISPIISEEFDHFFRRGWDRPDRSGAWSTDRDARVLFEVIEPRDIRLVFSAKSLPGLVPPLEISVSAGTHVLGSVGLSKDFTEYSVDLPRDALFRGWNVLTFSSSRLDRPTDLGLSPDTRTLGLCLHKVRLDLPGNNSQSTAQEARPGYRRIAPGAAAEFFFEDSAGTRVTIDLLSCLKHNGLAEIRMETDRSEDSHPMVVHPGMAGVSRSITIASNELTRVAVVNTGTVDLDLAGRSSNPPVGNTQDTCPPTFAGSILLMILDACTPEELGAYGCPDSLTPWIDRIAQRSRQFMNGVAPAPYTISSTAALLSGEQFNRHGVRILTDRISDDVGLIGEDLQRRGYYTVAFSSMPTVSRKYGFDRGFNEFHELFQNRDTQHINSAEVVDAVLGELPRIANKKPFFIYVHIREPHAPYHPDPRFHACFDRPPLEYGTADYLDFADRNPAQISPEQNMAIRRLYKAQIAQADRCLERMARSTRNLLHPELPLRIIFLSDHGESFGRHGRYGHNTTVFHDMTGIPLIIHDTDLNQIGFVSHLASGLLMKRYVRSRHPEQERIPCIIQRSTGYPICDIASTDGRFQYIRAGYYPAETLYDRESDPLERTNCLADHPIRGAMLRSTIVRTIGDDDRIAPRIADEIPSDMKEQLRVLGYTL